jgi:hypothetical protein
MRVWRELVQQNMSYKNFVIEATNIFNEITETPERFYAYLLLDHAWSSNNPFEGEKEYTMKYDNITKNILRDKDMDNLLKNRVKLDKIFSLSGILALRISYVPERKSVYIDRVVLKNKGVDELFRDYFFEIERNGSTEEDSLTVGIYYDQDLREQIDNIEALRRSNPDIIEKRVVSKKNYFRENSNL